MLGHAALAALGLGCGCWLLIAAVAFFNMRHTARLESLNPPAPDSWPKLSVIIPACNEEATLEAAMRVRLRETYPNVEFVVVDDRSTDTTGAIADRLAAGDPRFRVIHVASLPEGWLGKVHALQKGVESSDGDWILFTDADVHIEPGALERTIAWCEHRGLDHLAVIPRMETGSFAVGMVNSLFLRVAAMSMLVTLVENPRSRIAAGAGAFNLCRRSALAASPGLARLRLEIIDDIALGFLLKAYGARCGVLNGSGAVSVCWYPSLKAMKHGIEKNGFAIMGYNMGLMTAACVLSLFVEWAPFIALLQIGHPWLQALGGVGAVFGLGVTAAVSYWAHLRVAPAFFYPIAVLIFDYFLFRSGVLARRRDGVVWRGTLYRLDALRAFRRNPPQAECAGKDDGAAAS